MASKKKKAGAIIAIIIAVLTSVGVYLATGKVDPKPVIEATGENLPVILEKEDEKPDEELVLPEEDAE